MDHPRYARTQFGPPSRPASQPEPPHFAGTLAESLTALTGTPDVQEPAISVTADHTIWLATRACAPEGTCTGMVLVSADRGHTWRRIDVGGAVGGAPPQPQGFRLAGVSARAAWLIVPDRLPYHTTDGGRSWALQA